MLIMVLGFGLHAASIDKAAYHVRSGERLIFGFKTPHGKALGIAMGAHNRYLVYRYGKKGNVELEYPTRRDKSSFGAFTYSHYFRGGGAANAGLEIDGLHFENHHVMYEVFCEYDATDDATHVGVRVGGEDVISIRVPPGKYVGWLGDLEDWVER
jgi:hypothetical protein